MFVPDPLGNISGRAEKFRVAFKLRTITMFRDAEKYQFISSSVRLYFRKLRFLN